MTKSENKKDVAKKAAPKKPAAKKPVAKKAAPKKPAAKKPVAKKATPKKPVAKKPVAKKPAPAKKPTAKKAAPKKATTSKAKKAKVSDELIDGFVADCNKMKLSRTEMEVKAKNTFGEEATIVVQHINPSQVHFMVGDVRVPKNGKLIVKK